MQLSYFDNLRKFYFIGIGGISMSALAKFLLAGGYEVAGSDMTAGEQTEELALCGVKIFTEATRAIRCCGTRTRWIYTSAVSEENAELKEAAGAQGKKFEGGRIFECRQQNVLSRHGRRGQSRQDDVYGPCARIFSAKQTFLSPRISEARTGFRQLLYERSGFFCDRGVRI